jgi:hypothetical protein
MSPASYLGINQLGASVDTTASDAPKKGRFGTFFVQYEPKKSNLSLVILA